MLVVGYSPQVLGRRDDGHERLVEQHSAAELLGARCRYGPRWRVAAYFLYSISRFLCRLLFAAPRVVQVIVASRGDALRIRRISCWRNSAAVKCVFTSTRTERDSRAARQDRPPRLDNVEARDGYCFLSNRLRRVRWRLRQPQAVRRDPKSPVRRMAPAGSVLPGPIAGKSWFFLVVGLPRKALTSCWP